MADRVAADNPAVETLRGAVERAGRTDRPVVALPDAFDVPDGPVRLVVDGRSRYARIECGLDGTPSIRAAYDSPSHARDPPGGGDRAPNRLAEWVADAGLAFGRSVLVDVVVAGEHYGLRAPGESAVYEASPRDESLAALADTIQAAESSAAEDGTGSTDDRER